MALIRKLKNSSNQSIYPVTSDKAIQAGGGALSLIIGPEDQGFNKYQQNFITTTASTGSNETISFLVLNNKYITTKTNSKNNIGILSIYLIDCNSQNGASLVFQNLETGDKYTSNGQIDWDDYNHGLMDWTFDSLWNLDHWNT